MRFSSRALSGLHPSQSLPVEKAVAHRRQTVHCAGGALSRTETAPVPGKSAGTGYVTGRRASHSSARGMIVCTAASCKPGAFASPGHNMPVGRNIDAPFAVSRRPFHRPQQAQLRIGIPRIGQHLYPLRRAARVVIHFHLRRQPRPRQSRMNGIVAHAASPEHLPAAHVRCRALHQAESAPSRPCRSSESPCHSPHCASSGPTICSYSFQPTKAFSPA